MNKHSRVEVAYRFLVVIGLLTLSLNPAPSRAEQATSGVRYASPGGLTSGACDSWLKACELQTALWLAAAGEEVWAQQGIYKSTSSTDRTISFDLKNGVAIYGGFAGTETARDQRDWAANVTVLSGDIDNNDLTDPTGVVTDTTNISGTNSYHMVTSSGVTETAVLDGFTITAGQANGTGPSPEECNGHYCGGGMYNDNSSPTLTNIIFSGNAADHNGGGMYNMHSSPTLNTVTFSSNTSVAWDGGGMFNSDSSPVLTNVVFYGNRAAFFGGGMGNQPNNNSTLTNVTFSGNQATYGGGMSNRDSSNPMLINVTFNDNLGDDQGGGMYNFNQSSPTLTNVVFSGNQSPSGGGMNNYAGCSPSLTNVSFRDNQANSGGGMYNNTSTVVLTQVLFSGNKGVNGGAMHNFQSSVTMTNITMSGNLATGEGGGIYNDGSGPYIQNTLIWGNQSGSGGDNLFNSEFSGPTIRFSLVGGCNPGGIWNNACGVDGDNNLPDADPLFVAPEPASSAPTTAGDYRLQDTSPAINMGDNAADLDNPSGLGTATISSILSDLNGNPRFVRVFVDLGAYENQTFSCPAGDILYVDQAASGLQTGASWVDALTTLQDALQLTEPCEVWITAGLYYPDLGGSQADNNPAAAFRLKTGVALYGGFAGTETYRDQRNWATNLTVLSGDIDGNDLTDPTGVITTTTGITGTNSYHVLNGNSVTETAVLDGFTITAGNAKGIDGEYDGGGMYNISSSPMLANITFSGNSAKYHGGGMYIENSNPMLINVTFIGNDAANSGGGVYNHTSNTVLMNVTFSGNSASTGGGMHNVASSLILIDAIFNSNSAIYYGGGMYTDQSSPTLTNVIFSGNSAGEEGGGVYNHTSNTVLMNVTFSGNLAGIGGGMLSLDSSYPVLTNVTFSDNHATDGGGMANRYSSAPQIRNTIFWGNTASVGPQIFNDTSGSFTLSYSDAQGGCPAGGDCTHLLDADPRFIDAASGNLRLSPGSPVIDAGDNYSVTVTTDLAGGPRFVDIPAAPDTGLGTPPLVDMGAYEANFVDVGLVKTVSPLEAIPGQLITYTLSFSNGGSLPAVGVMITDAVPSFLTVQGVDFGGVLITDTGHIPDYVWAVQDLTAGQGGVITLTATLSEPLAAGVYTNTALITATEDAGVGNNRFDIGIHVLNVAPLAVGDSYTTLEDTPLQITPDSVLTNDSDDNGDALVAVKNSDPAQGLLSLYPNGSFVYTPTLDYHGPDSFTYHASDGVLNSDIVTVTLTVQRGYRVFLPVVQRNYEPQSRGDAPLLQFKVLISDLIRRYAVASENLIKVDHPV